LTITNQVLRSVQKCRLSNREKRLTVPENKTVIYFVIANYQILDVTKRIGEGTLQEEIAIVYLHQIFVSRAELLTCVLSRLKVLTLVFVCLQMNDGQIQQQDTISTLPSPSQHHLRVLEIPLILPNVLS